MEDHERGIITWMPSRAPHFLFQNPMHPSGGIHKNITHESSIKNNINLLSRMNCWVLIPQLSLGSEYFDGEWIVFRYFGEEMVCWTLGDWRHCGQIHDSRHMNGMHHLQGAAALDHQPRLCPCPILDVLNTSPVHEFIQVCIVARVSVPPVISGEVE